MLTKQEARQDLAQLPLVEGLLWIRIGGLFHLGAAGHGVLSRWTSGTLESNKTSSSNAVQTRTNPQAYALILAGSETAAEVPLT